VRRASAFILYIVLSAISAAGLNADLQYSCKYQWAESCNQYNSRKMLSVSIFIGAIPVIGWLAVPMVTGFYAHGLSFAMTPGRISDR
jgi:hypothetical protein